MADWPTELAAALDEAALTDDEITVLLDLARDVAHGTERRYAPLSTFLVGIALGRAPAGDRAATLAALADRVRAALPPPAEDGGA